MISVILSKGNLQWGGVTFEKFYNNLVILASSVFCNYAGKSHNLKLLLLINRVACLSLIYPCYPTLDLFLTLLFFPRSSCKRLTMNSNTSNTDCLLNMCLQGIWLLQRFNSTWSKKKWKKIHHPLGTPIQDKEKMKRIKSFSNKLVAEFWTLYSQSWSTRLYLNHKRA